jgi:hypothetical protein
MKRHRVERSPLYPKILFGFTEHPITVWAGVILLRVYFEWIKVRQELSEALGELCQAVKQSDKPCGGDAGVVLRVSVGSRAV